MNKKNTIYLLKTYGEDLEDDYESCINIMSHSYLNLTNANTHPTAENLLQEFEIIWIASTLDYLESNVDAFINNDSSLDLDFKNLIDMIILEEVDTFEIEELKDVLKKHYKINYPSDKLLKRIIEDEGFLLKVSEGVYVNTPGESVW